MQFLISCFNPKTAQLDYNMHIKIVLGFIGFTLQSNRNTKILQSIMCCAYACKLISENS